MAEILAMPNLYRQDNASGGSLLALGGTDPRQKYLPRIIVPYLTSTAPTLPRLAAGTLYLYDASTLGWLEIPYNDITKYEPRSARPASKRKVQIPLEASFTGGTLEVGVRRVYYQGRKPEEFVIVHRTGAGLDAAGKTAALATVAARINAEIGIGVTATSDATYLTLEETTAGEYTQVITGAGFGETEEIVPSAVRALYADDFRSADLLPGILPAGNIALSALDIYWDRKVDEQYPLGMGSSLSDSQVKRTLVPTIVTVLFDPATTSSTDAYTEIKAILDGAKALGLYLSKGVDGTVATNQNLEFGYLINRTDAGNDAALAAMRTAYAGASLVISRRAAYNAATGKSWYYVETPSATPPTAQGTDTVKRGEFSKDDDDPGANLV